MLSLSVIPRYLYDGLILATFALLPQHLILWWWLQLAHPFNISFPRNSPAGDRFDRESSVLFDIGLTLFKTRRYASHDSNIKFFTTFRYKWKVMSYSSFLPSTFRSILSAVRFSNHIRACSMLVIAMEFSRHGNFLFIAFVR